MFYVKIHDLCSVSSAMYVLFLRPPFFLCVPNLHILVYNIDVHIVLNDVSNYIILAFLFCRDCALMLLYSVCYCDTVNMLTFILWVLCTRMV